jgi:2-polyprenyl-3-methyl-5-hydroxy-6-metoxy-1,4-benzoquinol methylase
MNKSSKQSEQACPVCAFPDLEIFFEMLNVPVYCNLLWPEQQAARNCPRGDIKLAFCPQCGFITNVAFDPARLEYSQDYENSLHCSPRFQDYAQSLATRLLERHNLYDKDIIEIGCGKGDFLLLLCELGNNRGVGFDPSYVPQTDPRQAKEQVKFIQDFYSQRYANYQGDLVCCRHTLEHIQNPKDLLKPLRQAIGDRLNTAVFFEVPNALHTFRHLAIWDIIYEHCCYFTPLSLAHTFSFCGFRISELSEEFDGQFIGLEALPDQGEADSIDRQRSEVEQLAGDVNAFATNFKQKVETWSSELKQIADKGQRAVVWGAGSKGVTFLNVLNIQTPIEYVVDINPRKQGMYVAGTGQQIVSPQFLENYQPDVVLVMNPIYQSEIQQLTQSLGLNIEFMCV